jgi:hypothetical protein
VEGLGPLQATDIKGENKSKDQAGTSETEMKGKDKIEDQAGKSEAEMKGEDKVEDKAEDEWTEGGWVAPSGNFGKQVIEMLMRIEDRCDKAARKTEIIEARMMRLVYKEYEVIRLISQGIVEANPEISKDWIKCRVRSELQHFVDAQERQGKKVDDVQKGKIVKDAISMAQDSMFAMNVKDQQRIVQTCSDMKENCKAWFFFEASNLKSVKATRSS